MNVTHAWIQVAYMQTASGCQCRQPAAVTGCLCIWSCIEAVPLRSVDDLAQLYHNVRYDRSTRSSLSSRHGSTPRQTRDACMVGLTLSVVLFGAVPEPLREDYEGCGDVLAPKWDWKLKLKVVVWIQVLEAWHCHQQRLRLWRTFHDDLGETSGSETGDHTADESASFLPRKSRQWARLLLLRRRCSTSRTSHSLQNAPR